MQPEIPVIDSEWTKENQTTIFESLTLSAEAALLKLRSPNDEFLWASDSPNFKFAFFGRDTSTVVENIADRPEYHEQCILWLVSLARFQGVDTNTTTDERQGAIPHEIRSLVMDGLEIDDNAKMLFEALRPRWSENPESDTIVYYGELDGPARFVKACVALARNGVELDSVTYTHMSGEVRNLLDACDLAILYIQDRRDESDLDLVELQPPVNPETLTNQTLKDSRTSYVHNIDGRPVIANRSSPRAPLEAQMLSYEALVAYAELLEASNPDNADDLRGRASSLRNTTLEYFVATDNSKSFQQPHTYLVAMIDRDPTTGIPRQLNTQMSDDAEGMNGSFLSGDKPVVQTLRHSITRKITSEEFLTNGGIRCRALNDKGRYNFAGYHDTTTWPPITHAVAMGQLKQGYPRIAQELWTRMLCTMFESGDFQEFNYFDSDGRLFLSANRSTEPAKWVLRAEEIPQQNQAWSISAALDAMNMMSLLSDPWTEHSMSSDIEFENNILSTMTEYRNSPHLLIQKLKKEKQFYVLDKVDQLPGAHEVDLTAINNSDKVLRPIY